MGKFLKALERIGLGKRRNASRHSILDKVEHTEVKFNIQDEMMLQQLDMISLTFEEMKLAKAVQPLISEHVEEIVETFYRTITNVEHLKNIIIKNSNLDRLRKTLEVHLIEMFSGQWDEAFLAKRIRIANVHYKIGLEPKWYMAAFQNLQSSLFQIINTHVEDYEENARISEVITKILNFEQQLVLEAYETKNTEQLQMQEDKIKQELKAKIIAVTEDMANITERTNASVQQLVASSELMNQSVLRGADASRDTQQMAQDGQQKMQELKERVDAILSRADDMKQTVQQLNDAVKEIGQVIGIVQSIADDTNLLSLNSSIEAARAGEHGAGFAVVSEEIRNLSSQTKDSVEQVKGYMEQAETFSDMVNSVIAEVHHFIQEGQAQSEVADESFDRILQSMSAYLGDVQTVEGGMSTLTHNIKEISDAMENVSVSAETLYEAVENI